MSLLSYSRRQALAGLAVGTATLAFSGCTAKKALQPLTAAPLDEAGATSLLDSIADRLLAHAPETATSLGVDIGAKAALRGKLADRSAQGQAAIAATLKQDLARVRAVNATALSHATRTSLAVVESAYASALDGFALPYGDVAVGSWRNTPYVVI